MLLAFTLVAAGSDALQEVLPAALEAVAAAGRPVRETAILGEGAVDMLVEGEGPPALRGHAQRTLERLPVDFCVQPAEGRRKRLLLADMDSTVIGCECLDELAAFAGAGEKVAALTARAMAGEIAFEAALRERVAMLRGLDLTVLRRVYDERVRLTAGAATLAMTMTAHGARCVLVSGGFDYFTARVAEAAGFTAYRANRLIDDGARLTGAVAEPILGRAAKLASLREETAAMGLDPVETMAVGDGANDVEMIEAAGLGVAWRAQPILAARADARVDHADLTALLYFQGYGADAFAG
ncbi:MAG: phosphoserine phosphatase SerB [Caulobacteraceae bacterium]